MQKKLMARFAVVTVLLLAVVGLGSPADAGPKGFVEGDFGVGYFYGTFNQSPNIVLLAGGTVEEFCANNPDDPANAEPGSAIARFFSRRDGSLDIKVNDKGQPIHLYYVEFPGAPPWLEQVCADLAAGEPAPVPFASGTANLKVRISVESESLVDVFNSVNGKASGPDGTRYKVRASADLIVQDGEPVGNPEDFVDFELVEIGP
jgi:hypothetical protein